MIKAVGDELTKKLYDDLREVDRLINNEQPEEAFQQCELVWQNWPEPKGRLDISETLLRALMKRLIRINKFDRGMEMINLFLESVAEGYDYYGPYFYLGCMYHGKNKFEESYKNFDVANKSSKGRCFVDEPRVYKDFYKSFKVGS